MKVGVFFGGRSVEHEVSIISAIQAINAIDKEKYNVIPIYITKQGVWYTGETALQHGKLPGDGQITRRVSKNPTVGELR